MINPSVAFICTGNICRSPMAEVVARDYVAKIGAQLVVESFGTAAWHQGQSMDPRALAALQSAGYVDHGHLARGLSVAELDRFALIAVADRSHLKILSSLASGRFADRVVTLRSFDPAASGVQDLADPYYEDDEAFATCLRQIEASIPQLIDSLL
ncbi:MAG: low molecular weight phosphotyrosine protein phosphatase [Actinobacteria bacterium]|nr:low molecular weight phosphotyrosine protein phosphatase [Actinomycetota bacterium]